MGERKVLNKYYPPDFDPSKIPRCRQPKNQQMEVRTMLPMSICCNTCGNYIYKGTKFNSRKEDVIGETYLGIQIFRFYFKCTKCSADFTYKTDTQNSDYVVEAGATRNFEPWRSTDEAIDDAKRKRDAEELGDAMKALENRTLDSKREMDILAALDEMRSMRARHAGVGTEAMLEVLRRTAELKEKELDEEDEALLKSVVFQSSENYVRRVNDDDVEDDFDTEKARMDISSEASISLNTSELETSIADTVSQDKATLSGHSRPSFAVRSNNIAFNVKPKMTSQVKEKMHPPQMEITGSKLSSEKLELPESNDGAKTGLASLCASYNSDSSD